MKLNIFNQHLQQEA